MLLFFQGNIIIVVFSITRDVFCNLNEWREFHALLFCNTLCFKYHQIIHRRFEGIQFKILTFPDKTLAVLLDGLAVRIRLLEKRLIKIAAYLAFCFYLFCVRYSLLGSMYKYFLFFKAALAQTNLTIRFTSKYVCTISLSILFGTLPVNLTIYFLSSSIG